MLEKILIFGKEGISHNLFHKHKHLTNLDKVDIDRIVLFDKDSYGKRCAFNYFIGYGKLNTNFHGNKIPEENECYSYFSVLLLDFVVKVNTKYYPQTLLEECKYAIKRRYNKCN